VNFLRQHFPFPAANEEHAAYGIGFRVDTPPLQGLRMEPKRLQMGSCRNGVAYCFARLQMEPARLRPRTLRCGGRQGSPLRCDERTESVRP
jgi:hypothetical protein